MPDEELRHVENCYGCGENNPVGLKMRFTVQPDQVIGTFISGANHAGPPQVVHGGVIAAAVDETFSVFVRQVLKQDARTVRFQIVYRQPLAVGETLSVLAKLKDQNRKTFVVTAVASVNEKVVAEAQGTLFKWLPLSPS